MLLTLCALLTRCRTVPCRLVSRRAVLTRAVSCAAGANVFLTDECRCLKLGDFGCSVKIVAHTTMQGEVKGLVGTPGEPSSALPPPPPPSSGGQYKEAQRRADSIELIFDGHGDFNVTLAGQR